MPILFFRSNYGRDILREMSLAEGAHLRPLRQRIARLTIDADISIDPVTDDNRWVALGTGDINIREFDVGAYGIGRAGQVGDNAALLPG